jgi:hypothetical protein
MDFDIFRYVSIFLTSFGHNLGALLKGRSLKSNASAMLKNSLRFRVSSCWTL